MSGSRTIGFGNNVRALGSGLPLATCGNGVFVAPCADGGLAETEEVGQVFVESQPKGIANLAFGHVHSDESRAMNSVWSIGLDRIMPTVQRMTLGERLQYALDARRRDATSLIQSTGLSKGTIYNILNDTTKADKVWAKTAREICRDLRLSMDWFLTGAGPMDVLTPAANDDDWEDILGYAQAVGLGKGAEAQEYAETHALKFRAQSLAKQRLVADRLAVLYGDGDSMQPRIMPGDAVLFDKSDTRPRDGKVYVVQLGSEVFAKRCEIIDDTVFFRSDNPQGDHNWRKPKRMDSERHLITILGRVRWIGSWEG